MMMNSEAQNFTTGLVCQWANCNKVLPSNYDLKLHLEEHLGSKKAEYACEWKDCTFGKRRKIYDMKSHITLHHQFASYVCKVCQKSFLRDQELWKHSTLGCKKKDTPSPSNNNSFPSPDSYYGSPNSDTNAEVPLSHSSSPYQQGNDMVVPDSSTRKRKATDFNFDEFVESIKKDRVDPVPSKETLDFLMSASDYLAEDPEFVSKIDMQEATEFLESLKESIELADDDYLSWIPGYYESTLPHEQPVSNLAMSEVNLFPFVQTVPTLPIMTAYGKSVSIPKNKMPRNTQVKSSPAPAPSPSPSPSPMMITQPRAPPPTSSPRSVSLSPSPASASMKKKMSSPMVTQSEEKEALTEDELVIQASKSLQLMSSHRIEQPKPQPKLTKQEALAILNKLLEKSQRR